MLGIVSYIPQSDKVGFKTNTNFYKINKLDLESGEYIIPVPFYRNREARIIRQNQNGMFTISVLGVSPRHKKLQKITVGSSEISWYLVDSTNWIPNNRSTAKTKYGLTNFDCSFFERING